MSQSEFVEAFRKYQLTGLPCQPSTQRLTKDGMVIFSGETDQCNDNTVLSPNLNASPEKVRETALEMIQHFDAAKRNFEWKLYDFDFLSLIEPILVDLGFQLAREDEVMFAPTSLDVPLPNSKVVTVRPQSDSDFEGIASVLKEVWGKEFAPFVAELRSEAKVPGGRTEIFLALHEDQPVSCGWVRHYGEISFFFGGSTALKHRGLGAYRNLVKLRIEAARAKGAHYVVSECSPESERVLRGVGFEKAGQGRVYNYTF